MELSIRGLNLSLVTDLDLPGQGFGYETLVVDNRDAAQTWKNLEAGRDCITEIPRERWDWREYYGDPLTENNKSNVGKPCNIFRHFH